MKRTITQVACFILLSCCWASRAWAQASASTVQDDVYENFRKAILRMQNEYKTMNRMHIVMTVQVYDDKADAKPFFSEVADIRRDGVKYRYTFAGQEMLMNDSYLVMVDHQAREIFCNRRNLQNEMETFRDAFQLNMDSLLSLYSNKIRWSDSDETDRFHLMQDKGPVTQVDISINKRTGLLARMQYTYRDGQFVRVDFQRFDKAPEFDASTFSEQNYITMRNGNVQPASRFRGFNVSDAQTEK